jgi:hypothetical protein
MSFRSEFTKKMPVYPIMRAKTTSMEPSSFALSFASMDDVREDAHQGVDRRVGFVRDVC